MEAKRPGGVTLVAVLTWINGALVLVSGLLMLFTDTLGDAHVVNATVMTVLGLLVILVAGGLLRGNTASRMIITILQVFTLANAASHLFFSTESVLADVLSIAFAVIILLMLWSRSANRFFARS